LVRISRFRRSRTKGVDAAEFEIASIDQADSLCLILDNGDLVVLHVIAEGEGTTDPKTFPFGGSDLVADALGSNFPLELGEGPKHVER
jgi:hypothetical protein